MKRGLLANIISVLPYLFLLLLFRPTLFTFLVITCLQVVLAILTYIWLIPHVKFAHLRSKALKDSVNNYSSIERNNNENNEFLTVFDSLPIATINPMRNPGWIITPYEHIRLSILSGVLAIIRLVGFSIVVLIGYSLSRLILFNYSYSHDSVRPLSKWRRVITQINKITARMACVVLGFYYINTKGRAASRKEARILVSNHSSFVDSFPILAECMPSPIGALEHMNVPILGIIVKGLQCVFVDRTGSNKNNNTAVVDAIMRRAHSKDENWPHMLLFAEGTCSNNNSFILFRPGAFLPGKPIQPIHLDYTNTSYPRDNQPQHLCWVNEGPSLLVNVFRTMCEPVQSLKLTYFPVYYPNELEIKNPTVYSDNFRTYFSQITQLPITNFSYEDVKLQQMVAKTLYLVPYTMSIDVYALRKMYSTLTFQEIKDYLLKYIEAVKFSKNAYKGKLDFQQFCTSLGMDPINSITIRYLVYYITINHNTSSRPIVIDWRESIILYGLIKHKPCKNLLQACFSLFQFDFSSKVSEYQFITIFTKFFHNTINKSILRKLYNAASNSNSNSDSENQGVLASELVKYMESDRELCKQIEEQAKNIAITQRLNSST